MTNDIPAPGTYNPSDLDSTTNSYILSTNKNNAVKKFVTPVKPKHPPAVDYHFSRAGDDTPGPGSYTITSDIGVVFQQSVSATRNSRLNTIQDGRLSKFSRGTNNMSELSTYQAGDFDRSNSNIVKSTYTPTKRKVRT